MILIEDYDKITKEVCKRLHSIPTSFVKGVI